MNKRYFVAPSLPTLILGEAPDISFEQLIDRLETNLGQKVLKKVKTLRRYIDLHNIRDLYLGLPLDTRGNLTERELDEALLVEVDLPYYVFDFLGQFDENKEKVRHFSGLLSQYFAQEGKAQEGFLKELLKLQREMRLIMTALRAKKMGRDITKELQFEDFTDPLVAQILAQKDMEDYQPPIEYQPLKESLDACGENPWEQYKAVIAFEFLSIEEMVGYSLFSLDWILGYVARLLLVEKWISLDEEKGKTLLDSYKTGS